MKNFKKPQLWTLVVELAFNPSVASICTAKLQNKRFVGRHSGHVHDAAKSNVKHQRPEADIKSAKMPIEVFFDKVNFKDTGNVLVISMGYVWNEIQKNPKARVKALKWIQSHMHLPMVFHVHERIKCWHEMQWR